MVKQSKRTKKFIKNKLGGEIKRRKDFKSKNKWIKKKEEKEEVESSEDESKEKVQDVGLDMEKYFNEDGSEDIEDVSSEEEMEFGDEEGEDIDMAEYKPAETKGNKSVKKALLQHKNELQKLKEQDPEFLKFLQQTDPALLRFGEGEDLEDLESEAESDGEADDVGSQSGSESDGQEDEEEEDNAAPEEAEEEAEDAVQGKSKVITSAVLKRWIDSALKTPSPAIVRRIIVAFRIATESTKTLDESELKALPYRITSAGVFNELMFFCLKTMDSLFDDLLPGWAEKGHDGKKPSPTAHSKWKSTRSLVKSYLHALLNFVSDLNESSMLAVVCRHLERLAPYNASFPGLARNALKTLLRLWASTEHEVRVTAFLATHALTLNHTPAFYDDVLKACFLTYFRNSKFVNGTTRPVITFLRVAVVAMYGSGDFATSYQHAFVYVRELAIHLRTALSSKSKESIARVYSWQYLNSLQLWTDLLVQHPNQPALRHLFYPLIQILTGVVGFVSGLRYTPYRLQCVRMLNQLGQASGLFVNSAPHLLDLLEHSDLARKSSEGRLKILNLEQLLKLPKATTQTKLFKDRTVALLLELLLQNLASFSLSIAFPELVFSIHRRLKKYMNQCKSPNYSKQVKRLSTVIRENIAWIESKRGNVSFAPKDTQSVSQFGAEETESPLQKAWKEAEANSKKQQDEWAEMEQDEEDELSDGEVDLESNMTKKKRQQQDAGNASKRQKKDSDHEDSASEDIPEDAVTDLQLSEEDSE